MTGRGGQSIYGQDPLTLLSCLPNLQYRQTTGLGYTQVANEEDELNCANEAAGRTQVNETRPGWNQQRSPRELDLPWVLRDVRSDW